MGERVSTKETKRTLASVLTAYEKQVLRDDVLCHSQSQEHLEGYKDVLAFLADRGGMHREYKHYATRARIAGILRDSALYLTDGASWNDKYDREHFNPFFMSTKRFGACFSASSTESVAMWMLYGGMDGNGAMINFDRRTLQGAMGRESYECGWFGTDGRFQCLMELPADRLRLCLVDILYFQNHADGNVTVGRSSLEGGRHVMSGRAFNGIGQIAKHRSWSYENEVRLVATISRLDLAGKESRIKCVKIPIDFDGSFVADRVFDSPVSDDEGNYRDSELRGTVDWNLCSGCAKADA